MRNRSRLAGTQYLFMMAVWVVLGLVLGPTIEGNLRRSIISAGSVGGMFRDIFTHPLSLLLLAILVLMMVTQIIGSRKKA